MQNEWISPDEFRGLYEVSRNGDVRRMRRIFSDSMGRRYDLPVRPIKQKLNYRGYFVVGLSVGCGDGRLRHRSVHRLVASAFIQNPLGLPVVNHINGVKTDNRVENLEWCTPKENTLHAINIGIYKTAGSDNSNSKLTEADVVKILELHRAGMRLSDIHRIFQSTIVKSTIVHIIKGRTWKSLQ